MEKDQKPKTKICKYCKSEIPKDAKICPYCRKKQKSGKWAGIAVVLIVFIFIGIACSGGSDKPKKVATTSSSASVTSSAAQKSTSQKETPAAAKKEDTFTIGDTAEFDGIRVTLSSAILSKGGQYLKPDDGKYYLGLVFDIDNQSSKDIDISSIASFEAYCDDYSLNQDIGGYQAPEFDGLGQLDGDVAAGKKISGVICYQVPTGFSNFEISCRPDFWGSNKVTFKFNKDAVDSSSLG